LPVVGSGFPLIVDSCDDADTTRSKGNQWRDFEDSTASLPAAFEGQKRGKTAANGAGEAGEFLGYAVTIWMIL